MFAIASDKLAARLRPRRAIPSSIRAPTDRQIAGSLRKLAAGYAKVSHTFANGLDTPPEELSPLRRQVHALLGDPTLEALAAAEPEALAGALIAAVRADPTQSLLPAIARARGLEAALDAWVGSRPYGLDSDGNWTVRVFLTRGSRRYRRPDPEPLRAEVCAADEAAYARARDRAAALRATLELDHRAELAFCFPDEPWADADLAAYNALGPSERGGVWLLTAVRDPAVAREALARPLEHALGAVALDLAAGLPEPDAIELLGQMLPPLLIKPKYGPLLKTPPRMVAEALACFDAEPAAELLASYAGNSVLSAVVAEYFRSFPERLGALERHATGKQSRRTLEAIEAGQRAAAESVAEAPAERIPTVLRERPWRPRKRSKEPAVDLGLHLPTDLDESLDPDWLARDTEPDRRPGSTVRPMTEPELETWRARVEAGKHCHADHEWVYPDDIYRLVPASAGVDAWNRGRASPNDGVARFLRTHGAAAIPGLLHVRWWTWMTYDEGPEYLDTCLAVRSPRLAPMWATLAARTKNLRGAALGWLASDPRRAAIGLIPVATGPAGSEREDARAALFDLARLGHEDAILEASRGYSPAAEAEIGALLARDPLGIDAKAPKHPDFLHPAELPPLELRSGGALPAEAVDALLEMLSAAPAEPPYAGTGLVADAVDPGSLDAWLGALFDQWVLGGGGGRHDWMLHAHTAFDAPNTTRRVGEQLRSWASTKKANAERLADALAAVGSDQALMHLAHVAQTSRFAALRVHVRRLLDRIAQRRGLTAEQLADRTVPDLGLDDRGALTLSFGERTFEVRLDGSLSITVLDPTGARHKTLPRPRNTDDPNSTKLAKARFSALKTDLASIGDRQTRRLEQAMRERRSWPAADFREWILGHRLVRHLAGGLVWQIPGGAAFRVAEDGTLADVEDDTFALPERAPVRIAHPLDLGGDLERWRERLADYERVPPFDQLGRPVFRAADGTPARTEGIAVPASSLIGWMERRGWRRDDAGMIGAWLRDLPGGGTARLPIAPGIEIAYLQHAGDQVLGALELPAPARDLDPAVLSELLFDTLGLADRR